MGRGLFIAAVFLVACGEAKDRPLLPEPMMDGGVDAGAGTDASKNDGALSKDSSVDDAAMNDGAVGMDAGPGMDVDEAMDAGASDAGNPSALCNEAPPGSGFQHQVLLFEGGDHTVTFTRDFGGLGGGHTSVWIMSRFTIERPGGGECVTETSRLEYDWTHHNWADSLTATADGLTWTLSMDLTQDGWNDQLTGADPSSEQIVVGPIQMTYVAGPDRF